jgi:hypothetical protein
MYNNFFLMTLFGNEKKFAPVHHSFILLLGFLFFGTMGHVHGEDHAHGRDSHQCPGCYIADSGAEAPPQSGGNISGIPFKWYYPTIPTQDHYSHSLFFYKHQRAPPL